MQEEVPETEITEWNSALGTLQRIDSLKKFMHSSFLTREWTDYINSIICYYYELECIMTQKEIEDNSAMLAMTQQLALTIENRPQMEDLKKIIAWQGELRTFEQKAGLNIPKKKDSRFGLARR